VLGSLAAWEVRHDIPIIFSPTAVTAALEVERFVWYYVREVVESINNLYRASAGNLNATES
jgi:hypothetical protein